MHPGVKTPLLKLIRAFALLLLLGTVLSLMSRYGLVFELFSHFAVQYLCMALVLLVAFMLAREGRWMVLMSAVVIIHGVNVLPWYFAGRDAVPDSILAIRVLQSNVSSGNRDAAALEKLIAEERPGLLVVQEVTDYWDTRLKRIASLPHAVVLPRNDNFGIALYSKWPVLESHVHTFGRMALPSIQARLDVDGQPVTVIAVHPPPPITLELYQERNRSLAELADFVAGLDGPTIVAGDLNSSMWSSDYRSLKEVAGLRNTRAGFGTLPTWPAGFSIMRIPLDHCLVSDTIVVAGMKVGPDIGSDHLPVIVELGITST